MKAMHKLAIVLSLGALLPVAVSAKTAAEAYVDAYPKSPGAPVPISVVSPTAIGASYAGSTVELTFTVDAKGAPSAFTITSSPDDEIARVMVDAVSKWRFAPAVRNGKAVATKVRLPLRVSPVGTYAAL